MKKLNIIYEDKEILVVDKEPKQLTIATQKKEKNTLYSEAREYVKKQYPKNKIFIVHRLDRDTSGLVLFAKNEQKKIKLQNNWDKVKREYYCIVEGHLNKKKDVLKHYLIETSTLDVYVTKDPKKGKLAITEYEVLKENNKYSLLKINIKTGRRNQIRASLAEIGHPIVGDKKYSKHKSNRLYLHAYLLEYTDNNKTYNFTTKYPKEFNNLIKMDMI